MSMITLGTSFKTAPLAVREHWVYDKLEMEHALKTLKAQQGIEEAVILSTCNRTEIYCHASDGAVLLNWFKSLSVVARYPQLLELIYMHEEDAAIRHLMRVACGLDSLVLGEPQILGQIKRAFQVAQGAGTVGKRFSRLFKEVFGASKEIRTHTALGRNPLSIAAVSVQLVLERFSQVELAAYGRFVVVMGTGETMGLVGRYLKKNKIEGFSVISKHRKRAEAFLKQLDVADAAKSQVADFTMAHTSLVHAKVVFTATQRAKSVLTIAHIEALMAERRLQGLPAQLCIVDLAVPRTAEAGLECVLGVTLYTVDDLLAIASGHYAERSQAAVEAEARISVRVDQFLNWERSLYKLSSLCLYRDQAKAECALVLTKAKKRLARGESPEAVVAYALNLLRNKLIHHPTLILKEVDDASCD
jgi:glutamyl-tRNA reductase